MLSVRVNEARNQVSADCTRRRTILRRFLLRCFGIRHASLRARRCSIGAIFDRRFVERYTDCDFDGVFDCDARQKRQITSRMDRLLVLLLRSSCCWLLSITLQTMNELNRQEWAGIDD